MEYAPERRDDTNSHNSHREIARWTKVVGFFTALLFIVSGIADFFIWGQYYVANKSQIDTREQLRAVVSQSNGFTQVLQDNAGKLSGINSFAVFHNYGGTRTNSFHGWISTHYFDSAPNNLDFSQPYDRINVPNKIVPQGSDITVGPARIPATDAAKIIARTGLGLVWGRLEWSDIFDKDAIHTIGFCMEILMPEKPISDSRIEVNYYRSDCNYNK